MTTFIRDLRYVSRKLWGARVFTGTAVLTLALGIGGTTAIFTLIHAVMLRALPVGDPSALDRRRRPMLRSGGRRAMGHVLVSAVRAVEGRAARVRRTDRVPGRRRAPRRPAAGRAVAAAAAFEYVTGNYFSTLGINAVAGRVFSAADDTASASPVIALSYHAWQGAYGGDPSIIGASLIIEGRAFTVAGVTPPGFYGETLRADPPDLWIPISTSR